MNLELPEIAIDFGAAAERAFTDAGGVDLARRAEEQPVTRVEVVAPLLDLLGALDLHVADDLDTALAGGELCRVAGRGNAQPAGRRRLASHAATLSERHHRPVADTAFKRAA